MRQMAEGEDDQDDEEYCILNIETRHEESINCVAYLQEAIATGSKDGIVKVFNLDLKITKKEVEKPNIKTSKYK